MEDTQWLIFIINLTQPRVIWEEETSTEELIQSDWPEVMSVKDCLVDD